MRFVGAHYPARPRPSRQVGLPNQGPPDRRQPNRRRAAQGGQLERPASDRHRHLDVTRGGASENRRRDIPANARLQAGRRDSRLPLIGRRQGWGRAAAAALDARPGLARISVHCQSPASTRPGSVCASDRRPVTAPGAWDCSDPMPPAPPHRDRPRLHYRARLHCRVRAVVVAAAALWGHWDWMCHHS